MKQYLAIVRWELRYYLRRISTWVYFGVFFALAYFFMLATGGAFDDIGVALGSGGKVLANAPFSLSAIMPVLSLFGVSIIAALAGNALYKDYEARSDPLFYTTPVSKGAFFGGRFTGTVIVNLIVLTGLGLGSLLATLSPWVHADKIGPFRLLAYVQPYVTIIIPNLLLTAAIFFALVSLTRQMLPNYVGGALLLIGYLLAGTLFNDIPNERLAALIDPFGLRAQASITRYWTIEEKNTRIVPLTGLLLYNRLIWLGVASVIFGGAFLKFRFTHVLGDAARKLDPSAPAPTPVVELPALKPLRMEALPSITTRFDAAARWTQFRSVFARALWRIVGSRYFGVIVGGGLLYLVVATRATGALFGTKTWPVTWQIESVVSGSFSIFMIVVIAFYSGELIWSERDVKLNQIYDATPVPNAVVFLAKFLALAAIIALLLLATMLAGIVVQASKGYYNFEIPLYLQSLFGFRFVDYLLIAALAMTIHVLANHKYMAHFFVVLVYFGIGLMSALGLEHNLYKFGSDGGYEYSDMNGWGPYAGPFAWWKLYWGAFTILLLLAASLYWVRGEETSFRARTQLARARFGSRARALAVGAALAFVGSGSFIFYNTNVLNVYRRGKAERHLRAEREKKYKKFENVPQPRIVGVKIRADLYPKRGDAIITGIYVLRNKTASRIDSVHVGIDEDLDVRKFDFDGGQTLVLDDRPRDYRIYRLTKPLAPGDSTVIHFDLAKLRRGFANDIRGIDVAGNGTFLENASFMPHIGYDTRLEIQDEDARKKEKLPPRERMRPPTDPATHLNNYISHDADWVDYDAVVSTDEDQIAMTSGYLEREWTENGRRFYHYRMDAPILNLWAFQSGRYAVKKDVWHDSAGNRDVDIAVLYHPAHAYNVDRMIDAVKKTLVYCSANFGPYQYHQIRIIEFPRYAAFAQSLPNTIPFSEAIGFIARLEKPTDVDYPFYVTAHEVAHQWWAHQVIGADAQGSTMLSETMAQYSALMVMEKEFGAANMRKFLEYELDSYLVGRSTERRKEQPLELGENQPYIHYRKGSLITYALRDYLGEPRMNAAIRGFLSATKFKGPPYPTSLELVDSLRSATPDSLRYLIGDFFEKITLYELKTDSSVVNDAPGGKFAVDVYVTSKKLYADSLGRETEAKGMNDWIDIGVFAKAPPKSDKTIDPDVGMPLHLAKHRIVAGAQKVSVVVDQKPYRAGIDPLHKLVDRLTRDNTQGVRDRTKAISPKKPPA